MMGNYHEIKCQVCGTNLQTQVPLEYCPVCSVYILDKFHLAGGGTGIEAPQSMEEADDSSVSR